jgi:cyclopropane-fatty-acyl-phospholipid synthase
MDLIQAARELLESPSRAFAFRLWDGTVLPPARDGGALGQVVLLSPRALDALLPPASERRLAEAVLDGDIEIEGDAIAVLVSAARWEGPRARVSLARALASVVVQRALAKGGGGAFAQALVSRLHTVSRDREAVRHHYDLSDDFYRLFLDPAMVYSCAYFAEGGEALEQAQQAKLDLVCRKLGLAPGERLLDVGCGWGAFLMHAAERHRVDALGITLSKNQLTETKRRLALSGAASRVAVAAADYRTLSASEKFHKVASIGMMEHVGRNRLDEYFGAVHRLMHPGGLFLNQAIADNSPDATTLPWASRREGGFIARYIFPDHDLVPLGQVVAAAERAGFEVRDVESLREHYDETLAIWLERLEARFDEAEKLVGRRRARAYRLYLASSAAAFRLGRISVFQLLLAKPSAEGRAVSVPRCRADWYRRAPSAARAGSAWRARPSQQSASQPEETPRDTRSSRGSRRPAPSAEPSGPHPG